MDVSDFTLLAFVVSGLLMFAAGFLTGQAKAERRNRLFRRIRGL
jgi:hypothetical protein